MALPRHLRQAPLRTPILVSCLKLEKSNEQMWLVLGALPGPTRVTTVSSIPRLSPGRVHPAPRTRLPSPATTDLDVGPHPGIPFVEWAWWRPRGGAPLLVGRLGLQHLFLTTALPPCPLDTDSYSYKHSIPSTYVTVENANGPL